MPPRLANHPLECLVFNTDFARNSYAPQMPGIFTLGEDAADALEKIKQQKERLTALESDIIGLQGTLGTDDGDTGKVADLRALRKGFEERCWRIKTNHDANFKDAFSGVRGAKDKFCDRALAEHQSNSSDLVAVEELRKKAATLFDQGLSRHELLPAIDFGTLRESESDPILPKRIVGKEDVNLAARIRRLGNSDWVRQGLGYVSGAPAPCPFCQQELSEALYRELNDYFDETFLNDVAQVKRVGSLYTSAASIALNQLRQILASQHELLDADKLKSLVDRLDTSLNANMRLLSQKEKELSTPVVLESITALSDGLSNVLSETNNRIDAHNTMVDNLATEQAHLKGQIWKCLIAEAKEDFDAYVLEQRNLNSAIANLTNRIAAKRNEYASLLGELTAIERDVTSVQPTVSTINAILNSFGFTGFRLKTAGTSGHLYEIVRPDGVDATATLSEGERSFITFLYFYHLLRGSISQSGMTADRIVVFDDPVSSLDSDVLFIVSSLIKKIIEETVAGTGYIQQVFVLTHNIYFHKEVSFDPKKSRRAHETFWIVRKSDNLSKIKFHESNPIRTSYELLWQEVGNPQRSNLTIQNSLRRIIESYFTLLGNMDKDDIIDIFEGRDKQICASLFSWVNDGSHAVHDDLYLSQDDQIVQRYLAVFKQIFEKTRHEGHYRMMMGTPPEPIGTAAVAVASAVETQTTTSRDIANAQPSGINL